MGVDTRLYLVSWQQAEYPYENGWQLLVLDADEAANLEELGKASEANDHIADFEMAPTTPITLEEFLSDFGYDFVPEKDPA